MRPTEKRFAPTRARVAIAARVPFAALLIALSLSALPFASCSRSGSRSGAIDVAGPAGPAEAAAREAARAAISGANLFVTKVDGLPPEFIMGVDASSALALEKSGVAFRDASGNPRDLFDTLRDYGVNAVRLRVWNDPYDAEGHGFGGGDCDIETAIELGKRATSRGLWVTLDFHYSYFWADPAKQQSPREWKALSVDDKAKALYSYTKKCLLRALDAGVDVRMAQIGNETTGSFCGEKNWIAICKLLNAGSRAVRDTAKKERASIDVVLHVTNPEKEGSYERFAEIFKKQGVDYDVFATSWYPYWHGSAENLTATLKRVAEISGKRVMCAEFSYAHTDADGDGFANTISAETMCEKPWPFTVQGQAYALREAINAIAEVGEAGIGVFYWEPAWLPVPGDSLGARQALWERDGSGWATSFAASYDPDDAGKFFGGSSWDNQALFGFDGKPLASLATWTLARTGSVAETRPDAIDPVTVKTRIGDRVVLPPAVTVAYNDGSRKEEAVVWDAAGEGVAASSGAGAVPVVDMGARGLGEYRVLGTTSSRMRAEARVSVVEKNYVENAGFEDADLSMWRVTNEGGVTTELAVADKASDAKSGSRAFHFWSRDRVSFTIEQTVTGLPPGTYKFGLALHGGDAKNQNMEIYAIAGGKRTAAKTDVDGWRNFRLPTVDGIVVSDGTATVGASIACDANGWGSLDDFALSPSGR